MNYAKDEQATTPMNAIGQIEKQAKREPWDECGIEEKIERIRRELLGAREMAHNAYRHANDAKDIAARHQHSQSGEVLRPVERHGGLIGAEGRGFDPLR